MAHQQRLNVAVIYLGLLGTCLFCGAMRNLFLSKRNLDTLGLPSDMAPFFVAVGALVLVLTIALIVSVVGLMMRKEWGLTWTKRICIMFMIIGFPVGTVIFGIAYWLIKDIEL